MAIGLLKWPHHVWPSARNQSQTVLVGPVPRHCGRLGPGHDIKVTGRVDGDDDVNVDVDKVVGHGSGGVVLDPLYMG